MSNAACVGSMGNRQQGNSLGYRTELTLSINTFSQTIGEEVNAP